MAIEGAVQPEPLNPDELLDLASRVMNNTLVLDKISESLQVKDILALRQTSTTWNNSFLPQLRKKHTPIWLTTRPPEPGIFADCGKPSVVQYTEDLGAYVPLGGDMPFVKYRIEGDNRTPTRDETFLHLQKFFTFSSWITSLHIQWSTTSQQDLPLTELRRIIFDWTPLLVDLKLERCQLYSSGLHPHSSNLAEFMPNQLQGSPNQHQPLKPIPNLRRFKFNCNFSPSVNTASHCLVQDLIQHAVGLESLSLKNMSPSCLVLTLLRLRESVEHVEKLKTLKLNQVALPELRVLVDLSQRKENALRLDTLTASIVCCNEAQDPLAQNRKETARLLNVFLAAQVGTLRKLSLAFVTTTHPAPGDYNPVPLTMIFGLRVRIPRMSGLRAFKLTRDDQVEVVLDYEDDEHGTLDLTFPILKHFTYRYWHGARASSRLNLEVDLRRVSPSEVTKLSVHECGNNFTIAKFRSLFPSVARLQLSLESVVMWDLMAQIWTLWPALKTLQIRIDYNYWSVFPGLQLDALLAGLDAFNISKMSSLKTEFNSLDLGTINVDTLWTLLDKYKCAPGISDSRHLQALTLEILNFNQLELTDIGGYLGLALTGSQTHNQLQHVTIHGVGRNLISEQCKAFIREIVGPIAVLDI